ncbi:MAG TPA: DsbE family thiol:disulfide interchange protein [Stellaceae bacterium]|jgi:cytochrome c biogenesis protein CcmG/thiol:disulfide interchange protein DsbE
MGRVLVIVPLALFVALVVYFFVAMHGGYDPSALPSAMVGKPVPAFDLPGPPAPPNYSGPPVKLGFSSRDMLGHVVLVNFFASWCVPCRAEHPVLMGLGPSAGVPLVGIAYKDKPTDAVGFLQEYGNPYVAIGLDESGRTGIDFGVYGVPETYIVDKHGIIRVRHVGPLTAESVAREILPAVRALQAQP